MSPPPEDSTSSRLRSVLPAIALVVAGTLAGLVVAELGARAFYERPWFDRLTEDQERSEHLSYRINRLGLRSGGFVSPKPEGVRRIYMAGDSFTFGQGVPEDDLIMPSLVEQGLRSLPPIDGIGEYEALNAGIPASLPKDWWKMWRQVGPAFQPDVVLIIFFLRDGTKTASIPEFFGVIRDEITNRNAADPLYRASYLYRMVRDLIDREEIVDRYTEAFHSAYFGSEEDQEEWLSAQRHVFLIKQSAEQMGATVGFVTYPILVDLDQGDDYPFQDICDVLEEFARRLGIPHLNLLDSFRGENGPDLWVSSYDQHPNPQGHAIAAEAITPFVSELLRASEIDLAGWAGPADRAQGVSQP